MRVFVTGATGFAGSHLISHLLRHGHQVSAIVHQESSHQILPSSVTVYAGDLLNGEQVKEIISKARPEMIYHLAGQASPGRSWQIPGQTIAVNTIGTVNVLEAALANGRPRTIVVTSAELYGAIQEADLPVTEKTLPIPSHPYGVSKLAAAQLIPLYWARYGLEVIEARPFNHIGRGQALGFVLPDFASQLAKIVLGQQPPQMWVGNLEARRDFTDVRDVVRAYADLGAQGVPGETYLICSNKPVAISELLSPLIELTKRDIEILQDPTRLRPSDIPCLYGSYAKIQQQTGWEPEISLEASIQTVYREWRQKAGRLGQE